ncbi:MAG: hypothetical protein H7232_15440 [Aeromicrobium sp.]|nr:hypothetical protein [Burkholderiales bacterium]
MQIRPLILAALLPILSIAPIAVAQSSFSLGDDAPGFSIGINVPSYPNLVRMPGYPV